MTNCQHMEAKNGDPIREYLQVTQQDSDRITGLNISRQQPPKANHSFYQEFSIRRMQLHHFQPGSISCSFLVPPRLTDRNGNLAVGAIANLVDFIGAMALYEKNAMPLSVDISISFLSTAKVNDELEIKSKLVGRKGAYNGTHVVLKNKSTGEMIAEGRHSLFLKPKSKI